MTTVTKATTVEFTAQPSAYAELDVGGIQLGAILSALEADERALGPVVGYDPETRRVDAIFQLEFRQQHDGQSGRMMRRRAEVVAHDIFAQALKIVGKPPLMCELAIVEGSDPDLLP